MKCPYCEKEMQTGYIPNGNQPVQWIPDGKKSPVLARSVSADGVSLDNSFSLKGYQAKAHYCAACKLVLARTV